MRKSKINPDISYLLKTVLLACVIIACHSVMIHAQKMQSLKVSDDRHYLVTENNEPFFWLGGTAWELLHRLNREESVCYLNDRKAKGFTIIQTVILAELDGLNTPNACGHLPLVDHDPTKLNDPYFEHVDFILQQAENLGMYVGLLPTWGDKYNKKWGVGPEIFTPDNASVFCELLAERYLAQKNIVWILGGDRIPEKDEHYEIIRSMARGIRKADSLHLITYHPVGGEKATDYFNEDWLSMDMFQSGHSRQSKEYQYVIESKSAIPSRPVINGESRYENIPDRFWENEERGWLDDADVRTSAYWSMLSGAAGYTYGCNDIWQMYTIDRNPVIQARTGWREALHLPGSTHMKFMKELLVVFPWQKMYNDQAAILNDNPEDSAYIVCALGADNDFLIAYTPAGRTIVPDLSRIDAPKVISFWYNPRSGKSKQIGVHLTSERLEFKPWSTGRGSDFVLVIMDMNSAYKLP